MIEIEAKFRCEDKDAIVALAKRLGFTTQKQKEHVDRYLLVNRKNPDGTRDYLRIREDVRSGRCSLDFHRVISALETRENEITIENGDDAESLFNGLGYEVRCVVQKVREEYHKKRTIITIDTVKNLGCFVEVESDSEKELRKTVDLLGLAFEERIKKKGYPDLLMETLRVKKGNFK